MDEVEPDLVNECCGSATYIRTATSGPTRLVAPKARTVRKFQMITRWQCHHVEKHNGQLIYFVDNPSVDGIPNR